MVNYRKPQSMSSWYATSAHTNPRQATHQISHVTRTRCRSRDASSTDSCQTKLTHVKPHITSTNISKPRQSVSIHINLCQSTLAYVTHVKPRQSVLIHVDSYQNHDNLCQSTSIHLKPHITSTNIKTTSICVNPHQSVSVHVNPRQVLP